MPIIITVTICSEGYALVISSVAVGNLEMSENISILDEIICIKLVQRTKK